MPPGSRQSVELEPVHEPSPAAWIIDRLFDGPPPPAVGSVLPRGYQAYVEISLRLDEDPSPRAQARDVLLSLTDLDQVSWWAMWEGWPRMNAISLPPSVEIPDDFGLHLFKHPMAHAHRLSSLTDQDETLWWPDDRSWVYARPVDSDAVYLAGNHELAAALLRCGAGGARLVSLGDPIIDDL